MARLSVRTPRLVRALLGCRHPVVIEGQTLDPDVQWLLHVERVLRIPPLTGDTVDAARQTYLRTSTLLAPRMACPTEEYVMDGVMEGTGGSLRARLYRPPGARGLLVYYHGGGWVIGDLESHDPVLRALAVHAGAKVLAVDYRLAPEHVFPAAADDAYAAFRWAAAHADELGVEPGRIAVGGDSAGGNLAAGVAQRARGERAQPCFQLLMYPGLDLVDEAPSITTFGRGFLLQHEDILWFKAHYVPDMAMRGLSLASPGRAEDVSGVAPACMLTAGFDPLRDEAHAYARRLTDAGVDCEYHCFSSLTHGFIHMAGEVVAARVALEYAAAAVRRGLR